MSEIWKVIPETNDRYFASNLGRVRGSDWMVSGKKPHYKKHMRKGVILKPSVHHSGYLVVGFQNKSRPVHRLVALAFIPNHSNFPCINHINATKTDNRPENLEWCTVRHNNNHARINGLVSPAKGERNGMVVLKEADISTIRSLVQSGIMQSVLADRYNVSRATICHVVKNKSWKHVV